MQSNYGRLIFIVAAAGFAFLAALLLVSPASGATSADLTRPAYPWSLTLLGLAGLALGCLLAHWLYLRRNRRA